MTASAFFNKMVGIKDELAAVDNIVDDEEVVNQILYGLDYDDNPFYFLNSWAI